MRLARHLTAFPVLLLAAGAACAQARGGDWVSYRDAYRVMVVFEKYGGPKSLIQNELQVVPREKGADGLELTLASAATQLHLPLDATGRTLFPLHKDAYDHNAVLVLNRTGGSFAVRPRVSIAVRPDGVYPAGDLRTACEQALGFARYADPSTRSRQCAGVRFVFAKKDVDAGARVHRPDGADAVLPMAGEAAFEGDQDGGFPAATYRFGGDGRALVLTTHAPLAIVPLFE
jgi:hypothetical protein